MRSVADIHRIQTRAQSARLTAVERIALALKLGDEDASALAAARSISLAQARRLIRRSRALGRPLSCATEPSSTESD